MTLFAWHVLPLGLYEQHEATLREQQPGVVSDITKTIGFKLLTSDPKSRLIINCEQSSRFPEADNANTEY